MLKKTVALLISLALMQPAFGNVASSVGQGSSQATVQGTSNGTSQGTANANVTTTIVVIGGIILAVGIPLSIVSTTVKGQQKAEQRVVYFMRNNHNELIHDISAGSGVLLEQIAYELGLDYAELKKIEVRLAGSPEQQKIMETLDGEIENDDAVNFSTNFAKIFLDALGSQRVEQILKKAWNQP